MFASGQTANYKTKQLLMANPSHWKESLKLGLSLFTERHLDMTWAIVNVKRVKSPDAKISITQDIYSECARILIPQLMNPDSLRNFKYLIPSATLSPTAICAFWGMWEVELSALHKQNMLLSFGLNQLIRPQIKLSIWWGSQWTPHRSVCLSWYVQMQQRGCVRLACTEQTRHKSPLPSTRQRHCAHQLGMIMGVSEAPTVVRWSVKPLERNREGRGRAWEEGWKYGGEAQLAAAPNWAEQVSMADQTHMQRGPKRGRERATSEVAGQAML